MFNAHLKPNTNMATLALIGGVTVTAILHNILALSGRSQVEEGPVEGVDAHLVCRSGGDGGGEEEDGWESYF